MEIEYTVSKDGVFVEAIVTNLLTTEEVIEYITTIEHDKRIKLGFVELFDVSNMNVSQIDEDGLDQIVEKIQESEKRSRGTKLAIVVSRGSSFDRAKYIEKKVGESQNVIVFSRRSTAEIWLGVKKGKS